MAFQATPLRQYQVHYQVNTKNISFIKMYNVLKNLGVRNNKFFLELKDPTLMNVDPHNERSLTIEQKARVLRECQTNFWYFAREVVRIPVPGGEIGGGVQYAIHRGNLAMNYCYINNINSYTELPRQNYKSISTVVWYLWLYNYGTSNSEIMFMNKKHEDSKLNLKRLKDIRETLPSYLQFVSSYNEQGKQLKGNDNVEFIDNAKTSNKIVTKPSARTKASADGLGRGCSQPSQWYDEYAFTPYNDTIYFAASPAFSQASLMAKRYKKPFGITITSTPGDLNTEFGKDAYEFIKECATFTEDFYDWNRAEVDDYIRANSKQNFVYIKYSYRQLGRSEEWFEDQCRLLRGNAAIIRREILLDWGRSSDLSPFSEEDLEIIHENVREHIRILYINKVYPIFIYSELSLDAPLLIGVDVSGGYSRDASSAVLVNSRTTDVVGVFRNNVIGVSEFTSFLYNLVRIYLPNSLLCIERNSYGEGVISALRNTNVKKNLYYEYKDRKSSEKVTKGFVHKNRTVKEYGVWTDKNTRDVMMEILREYVQFYKTKFISPIIAEELDGLQYIKGRIDHASGKHDDAVMGYLMALYVYHYGTNLAQFGIVRHQLSEETIGIDEEVTNYEGDVLEDIDTIDILKKHGLMEKKDMSDYYKEIEMELARYQSDEDASENGVEMLSDAFFDALNDVTGAMDDFDIYS